MSQVAVKRPRGTRTSLIYLGVWICLAVASLAYIVATLLKTDVLTDRLAAPGGRSGDPVATQGAILERGLADVRGQLTDVQLKVMRGELREQELAARISAVETRLEELAAAPPRAAAPVAPPPVAEKAPEKADRTAEKAEKAEKGRAATAQQRSQQTASATPATTQPNRAADGEATDGEPASRPAAKQKGAPLETASIPRPVQPFGAPEVKVERAEKSAETAPQQARADDGVVGIQLGGAPSLDSLRLNWTILSDRHGDSLGGLQPRYVTSDALGTTSFNLVAGPVPNRAEAIRICAKLRNQGVTCRLTAFQGSQL